jgi:hypothetical protein
MFAYKKLDSYLFIQKWTIIIAFNMPRDKTFPESGL